MAEPVTGKTPAEILDYEIDWAEQLVGDSLIGSTWAVQTALADLVALSGESVTGTRTRVFVGGGLVGRSILLTNAIETDAGRTLARTLSIPVSAYRPAGESHAQRVLAAIEAVLERRATVDQQSYGIEGRSLARMPIGDLLRFRDRYRAEVAAERAALDEADGRPSGRRVRTVFSW